MYAPRRFFCQRFPPATGSSADSSSLNDFVEVTFLDLNLSANIRPTPSVWQFKPRQNPGFQFFPRILRQKNTPLAKLLLDGSQSIASLQMAIAINAQDKDPRHTVVLFEYLR